MPLTLDDVTLDAMRTSVREKLEEVGGRNERSNRWVVETICDLLDDATARGGAPRRNLIAYATDRPGHDRRYAIDPSKIERELGWRAAEPFESGLEQTVAWYLSNRPWWQAMPCSATWMV